MPAHVPQPRAGDGSSEADHLDVELEVLRDKAQRMAGELSDLYRRLGELQQQIDDHRQHGRRAVI